MSLEPTEKRSLLIADDDPIFVNIAGACLEQAGFDVASAENGALAMEMLLHGSHDLAIIDLSMPEIDGLRLIALIRATRKLRTLPVLVITSLEDPSVRAEGLQVGANDFLTKPVDWPTLPGIVSDLISVE